MLAAESTAAECGSARSMLVSVSNDGETSLAESSSTTSRLAASRMRANERCS